MKNVLALEYLKIRGISKKSIEKFNLGYTYDNLGWQYFRKYFKYNTLFFTKSRGNYYDRLANRIIIPITFNGEIKGMTSRSIYNDSKIPHLHIFPGSISTFFNHDGLGLQSPVIVVESPFDAIHLDQKGFNTVANLGTNNDFGIQSLKGKEVFICFDNDENGAGEKGARSLAIKLFNCGTLARIIKLPKKGKKNDVSEFFKTHSKKDFENLMNKSCALDEVFRIKKELHKYEMGYKNYEERPQGERDKEIICCPYHSDSTASLVKYFDTSSFYCFGCGKSGTLESLNEELNGLL